MKVLVLSCNTGGGHNTAARAMTEELGRRGVDCLMLDTLSFGRKSTSEAVCKSYINTVRVAPRIFGYAYKIGDAISSNTRKSPVYYANKLYSKKLLEFILDEGFDTVLCPHLFPSEALTALRGYLKTNNIKFYNIATDYTCIPFWEETVCDGFFIPHKSLAGEFIEKGIPEEILFSTGIPVSQKFNTKKDKETARNELSIHRDGKLILIMSGSMGAGDIYTLIKKLLFKSEKSEIIVLCGTNTRLKNSLTARFEGECRLSLVSFTDKVSLYMDACDVLLTKPGGLSSTEAAVKNVPLVLISPIPGCETKNARFFMKNGLAYYCTDSDEAADCAVTLISDRELCEMQMNRQREIINPNAARDIADYIIKNIQ